jgi:hypothetical protein
MYELGKVVVVNGEILITITNGETMENEFITIKELRQNLSEYGVIPF